MNTKNLRFNYHIEIINDKKTWEKFLRVTGNYKKYKIEPWELYTNKDFDTFEKALEFYMVWYVSDQCYDIKMWQQIFIDNIMIYEEYVEPHCTTKSEMRRIIDRDTYDRLSAYERTTEELEKANNLYKGFIKAMGDKVEKMFDDYVKQEQLKEKNKCVIDEYKKEVLSRFCEYCDQYACNGSMIGSRQECTTICMLRDVCTDIANELKEQK